MEQNKAGADSRIIFDKPEKSPDAHLDFLEMIAMYYVKGLPQKNLPEGIELAVSYLRGLGVKSISLVGICWGGCIVQQIVSTGNKLILWILYNPCST